MATLYGDTSGTLSGKQKGAAQVLVGTDDENNSLFGDAGVSIIDSAQGGNDTLTGGDSTAGGFVFNRLFGDAETMSGSAKGGNDTLTGGDNTGSGGVFDDLFGDAFTMSGSAKGGNDTLIGGDNSANGIIAFNFQFGDAFTMSGSAKGGNDTLIGGDNSGSGNVVNNFFGDAPTMSGSAKGGNDTLTGGDNSGSGTVFNNLFGDASGSANGGNDTLTGGDNTGSGTVSNSLFGNAGDDRLISGINATDQMWGDDSATGGNDTFVFAGAFGEDFVNDFRQGEDIMEFQVAGVADFDDLIIDTSGPDPVISTTASATDTVTLVGFNGTLTANDFLFS